MLPRSYEKTSALCFMLNKTIIGFHKDESSFSGNLHVDSPDRVCGPHRDPFLRLPARRAEGLSTIKRRQVRPPPFSQAILLIL
jgi:hypothetical protein